MEILRCHVVLSSNGACEVPLIFFKISLLYLTRHIVLHPLKVLGTIIC